jgi:hypothetical protein
MTLIADFYFGYRGLLLLVPVVGVISGIGMEIIWPSRKGWE